MSIKNARLIKANVIINRYIRPVLKSLWERLLKPLSERLLKPLSDDISEAEKERRINDIYHNF